MNLFTQRRFAIVAALVAALPLSLVLTGCEGGNATTAVSTPAVPGANPFAGAYNSSVNLSDTRTAAVALTVAGDNTAAGTLTVAARTRATRQSLNIAIGTYDIVGGVDPATGAFTLTGSVPGLGAFTFVGAIGGSGGYTLTIGGQSYQGAFVPGSGTPIPNPNPNPAPNPVPVGLTVSGIGNITGLTDTTIFVPASTGREIYTIPGVGNAIAAFGSAGSRSVFIQITGDLTAGRRIAISALPANLNDTNNGNFVTFQESGAGIFYAKSGTLIIVSSDAAGLVVSLEGVRMVNSQNQDAFTFEGSVTIQ